LVVVEGGRGGGRRREKVWQKQNNGKKGLHELNDEIHNCML